MSLFHQTSVDNAEKIVKTQNMHPGHRGVVGGGIYFAALPSDTDRKAKRTGAVLAADVRVGNVLSTSDTRDVDPRRLRQRGYDSVRWTGGNGDEYIVFDGSAVSNIRLVAQR